ncbi:formin-like protein 5 isoform X2 [Strongylocentrotus purpuratus]|uniref:Uncharacterized protein n=1 Tax=Strongylocentrotus purpuratus TaxID=7668 RepID=A0A7M7P8M3_STRPU|nr:formin-like protein 5 isoform X2 [Strongylocentrotus purpuratus]
METFGEYDSATPLAQKYCSRISSQEYEAQASMETYAALQCKVLERVKGPNFMMADITDDESKEKLEQMQMEMCDVYNYVQDTRDSPVSKRFSKRLAAKRTNRGTSGKTTTPKRPKGPAPPPPPPYPPPGSCGPKEVPQGRSPAPSGSVLGITPSPRKPLRHEAASGSGRKTPKKPSGEVVGVAPVAPPPPPPPPLPSTMTPKTAAKKPLQERTNTVYITTPTGQSQSPAKKALLKSDPRLKQLKRAGSTTSLNSVSSIHEELMGFDKGKLKAVKSRSPGRIPKKKVPSKPSRTGKMGDITIDSFNMKILEKFKNVHSPSRYGSPSSECNSLSSSGFGSPSGFTP